MLTGYQQIVQPLLLVLDDWRVVWILAAIFLAIRMAWAAHRKRNPLPPAPPAPPRPKWLGMVQLALVLVVIVIAGFLHVDMIKTVVGLVIAYMAPEYLLKPAKAPSEADTTPAEARPSRRRRKAESDEEPAESERPSLPPRKDGFLELLDTILIALILVFGIVRPLLLQTFFIPSGSMEPTLLGPHENTAQTWYRSSKELGGDNLIANKFVYRVRPPKPGEVVVFQPPIEAIIGTTHDGNVLTLQLRRWLEQHPGVLAPAEVDALYRGYMAYGRNDEARARTNVAHTEDRQLLAALPQPPTRLDDYIKRVIAVGGDRVRIVAGDGVYVNDVRLPESYLPAGFNHSTISFPVPPPDPGQLPRLEEFKGHQTALDEYIRAFMISWEERSDPRNPDSGTVHTSYLNRWFDAELYNTRIAPHVQQGPNGLEYVVPQGTVFVQGDNRTKNGSYDSRFWGAVPLNQVKARAIATFWPLDRLKVL